MLSISVLYSISGSLITLLYIPQVLTVVRARSDLKEISLPTWGIWSLCMLISTLYSYHVAKDPKLAFFAFAGALFCFLITTATIYKRIKYGQKRMEVL